MLQYIPKGCSKVLEAGCGEGLFSHSLKLKSGAEVWGLELIAEEAEKAKSRLDKVLTGDFFECAGELPTNYFDCIVFNDVLEHFAYPDKALIECAKLLKSGGYIVSSIPNVRYIGNLKELLIKKDWQYKKEGGILDYTHLRFFTKKSIIHMFEEGGYELIKIEGLPTKMKWYFNIINALSLFQLSDAKYAQFAVVGKLKVESLKVIK
jgi:2-polyprenyl-3-methyl-5-hydroxy-6-metoxy-1,4-benzoquinol methylase